MTTKHIENAVRMLEKRPMIRRFGSYGFGSDEMYYDETVDEASTKLWIEAFRNELARRGWLTLLQRARDALQAVQDSTGETLAELTSGYDPPDGIEDLLFDLDSYLNDLPP